MKGCIQCDDAAFFIPFFMCVLPLKNGLLFLYIKILFIPLQFISNHKRTMNYKELFNRIVLLISSPAKAWEEICCEEDRKKVLSAFVYPLIGLCGLSVFIGTLIGNTAGASAFQIAMTRCCATFVSLFGGFFLAAYVTNLLGKRMLGMDEELELNRQFVGYAMVVTFVLDIISGLFSISILHWILQFYTVFVVYEGARMLMDVEERKLTRYSLIVSVVIILCPALIAGIFNKLSLILN